MSIRRISPTSKVVCQDCLDAMGEELRAMLARMEEASNADNESR